MSIINYRLILSLNITILDKKEDQSFSRKITYNNSDDKFGLKQYEYVQQLYSSNKDKFHIMLYLVYE